MKRLLQFLVCTLFLAVTGGCCIGSRNLVKETHVLTSGYNVCYTNGEQTVSYVSTYYDGTKKTNYTAKAIYYTTSYVGGPWQGSFLYPATRQTLNALSLYSYSSAASGDYMLGLPTLCIYPVVLIELPVQFVLDTVLIPYDLINQPHPPEGYVRRK